MSVREIVEKLRVKSGLKMDSRDLGNGFRLAFFYSRDRKQFAVSLSYKGQEQTMGLTKDMVESRSKSQWLTEKTWRLSPLGIDTVTSNIEKAISKTPRQNPLLAQPPQTYHRLQQEHRITKHGWFDPHIGVHVTDNELIAAGYAYSAMEQERYAGIPIVISINAEGMPVEPDVDALLWWYEGGGKEVAEEVLEHGVDDWDHESYQGSVVSGYLLDYLPRQVDWEEVGEGSEILEDAIAGKHEALRELLLTIFPQRRIMQDIDLSDVIEIRTFKPWDEQIIMDFDYESEVPDGALLYEEIDNWQPAWKTLWGRKRLRRDRVYHGTTSVALAKAFPELAKYPSFEKVGIT